MNMIKGNGWKCEIVITCDNENSLSEALESIIQNLSYGMNKNDSASDEFAYTYKLNKQEA